MYQIDDKPDNLRPNCLENASKILEKRKLMLN